jgi:6-phosphofructokinase 1
MGRSAGHLALGIGESTHCPMTIIPEMFNKTTITLDKIVRLALSAIIKRKLLGIPYGTIVVAEGVFHDLDPEEIKNAGVNLTYDEHGHPELGKISKAVLFNDILDKEFKKYGMKVKTRPVEIGYDVRCQDPIAYDLTYCTELAMGAYELFIKGETGCMVYVDAAGESHPLYLKELQGPDGKIPPRRVNIEGGTAQNYYSHICHYISEADYEAAKKYVEDPAYFDFKKILCW